MNTIGLIDAGSCVRVIVTLGHFLWQGVAIALLAGIVSFVLKRASSRTRYVVYVVALALMTIAPIATFAYLTLAPAREEPARAVVEETLPAPIVMTPEPTVTNPSPPPQETPPPTAELAEGPEDIAPVSWTRFAPRLAVAYLVGVALMLLRLLAGLYGGGRLRRMSQPVEDISLLAVFSRMAREIGLRFTPAIAFCSKVAVPTIVGMLKPMVLLPMSFATGLSAEQAEAVLAHELAHIRRHDYLLNVLQRIVEAALFFHPAVWWASRRIRIEREHCCDDAALGVGAAAAVYAESLVILAERARELCPAPALARVAVLGATDRSSSLRVRVLRLLGLTSPEPLRLARAWSVVLLLAATSLLATSLMVPTSAEPKGDVEGRAKALIEHFSAPEFAVRQKAVEELIAMGEDVLPLIRKTLAETKDAEVKLRCEMVIKGLDGEPVEGVSAHLIADKVQWKTWEAPTFKIDIRCGGEDGMLVPADGRLCTAELDGAWYYFEPHSLDLPWKALSPGQELRGLPLGLDPTWRTLDGNTDAVLGPGKHTVRVAFIPPKKDADESVRVISNPVEIEIVADAAVKPAAELNRSIVIEDLDWLKSIDLKDSVLTYVWHTLKPGMQHATNLDNYHRRKFTRRLSDEELSGFSAWIDACKVLSLPKTFEKEEGPGYAAQPGDRFAVSRGDERYEKKLDGRGEIPESFRLARESLERLCREIRDGVRWDVPADLRSRRNRLLDEADAAIRKGLRDLGETYPQMKKSNSWAGLTTPGPLQAGRLRISFFYTDLGKAPDMPRGTVPEKERVTVLVVIQPPPEEPVQLGMSPLYPSLGLVGQVGISAGDPDLAAALKKLVNGALAPLGDLDAAASLAWGDAVEGVQVRLRADKVQWRAGETPGFKADFRNRGERDLHLVLAAEWWERWELEMDGQWYRPTVAGDLRIEAFEPGVEHQGVRVPLEARGKWKTADERRPLLFTPGKHTIRIAFTADPMGKDAGEPIRVVSNPVEIEILPAEVKGVGEAP